MRCLRLYLLALLLFCATGTGVAQNDNPFPDTTATGFLAVSATVDSFYLVVNEDPYRAHLIGVADTLEIPSGRHLLRVVTRHQTDVMTRITIGPDSLAAMVFHVSDNAAPPHILIERSAYPRLYWAANLAIGTDNDTAVYVDGEHIGSGLVFATVPPGDRTVEIIGPSGRRQRVTTTVHDMRLRFVELTTKPDANRAFSLSFVPGASQFYQGRPLAGSLMAGVALTGVVGSVSGQIRYSGHRNDFLAAQRQYRLSNDEETALRRGDEMEAAYHRAQSAQRFRNVFLGVAGASVLASVIESFRRPSYGYRTRIDLRSSILPYLDEEGMRIGLQHNF